MIAIKSFTWSGTSWPSRSASKGSRPTTARSSARPKTMREAVRMWLPARDIREVVVQLPDDLRDLWGLATQR